MATATFVHGITSNELPTLIGATVTADSAVNFVVGVAPVQRLAAAKGTVVQVLTGAGTSASVTVSPVSGTTWQQIYNVNIPVFCQDISDFTNAFTYNDTYFAGETLCAHAYRSMIIGKIGGSVYLNVFDPSVMKSSIPMSQMTFVNSQITIANNKVVYNSVYVLDSTRTILYALGTDYVLGYISDPGQADNNYLTITQLSAGNIPSNATVYVGYDLAAMTMVTSSNIVGGFNSSTQTYTGLQAIETVFPESQIVPSVISIPQWDTNPAVAAAMEAACLVNGVFKAVAPIQINSTVAVAKDFVLAQKTAQNIEASNQIACWPETGLGSYIMPMSLQIAVQLAEVDISRNFLPYASPSNNALPMDRLCLHDGTTIRQSKPSADLLSGQAIVTGINWIGGWRSWGNYTAAYPGTTDPKDMWISCRRMENYIENTIQLTAFQFVDKPMNQRWAEQVIDTIQQWLNSLVKVGALLEGKISLRAQDNTLGELVGGHVIFYVQIMPPIPAQWIQMNVEVDPTALDNLFTLVSNASSTASQAIQTSVGS